MEKERNKKEPEKILIVDDISMNVKILENIIQEEGYEPLCALSAKEALEIMEVTMPQLILSDYSMPEMDGMEFCRLLKSNPRTREIPFIFITVADSSEEKKAAFEAGAVDFIPKPFERVEVVLRVNNHLNSYRIKQEMEDYNRMMHKMVAEQKKQLEREQENVLLALAKVVERRNIQTAKHLEKVGYNCRLLAQSLQLVPGYEQYITDTFVETIGIASKLHDIGNIVVSDDVISQQKEIDEEDGEGLKIHTEEGAKILEDIRQQSDSSRFLDMAILIARYHHAHWDGTGFPKGVGGDDIPMAARIAAVANDFDAMIGQCHGGEVHSVEDSVRIINERSGTFYDPHIVDVFNRVLKQLRTE